MRFSLKKRTLGIIACSLLFAIFGMTLSYTRAGLVLMYLIAFIMFALLLWGKASLVYYLLLLITLNMSEYSKFITQENFYTFRTVGIFGISFATIFVILLSIWKAIFSTKRYEPFNCRLFQWGLFLFLGALANGVIHIFSGETNRGAFLSDLFYFLVLYGSFYLAYEFGDEEIVKEILLVAVFTGPFVVVLGWFFMPLGYYGGGAPIAAFDPLGYTTALVPSFLLYRGKSSRGQVPMGVLIVGSTFSVLAIFLQASGKILLFIPISIVLVLALSIWKRAQLTYLRYTFMSLVAILLFVLLTVPIYSYMSSKYEVSLLSVKSQQIKSMVSICAEAMEDPELIYEMAASPRLRFLEFLNILGELKETPPDILVGKGLGGSFSDELYPIPYGPGAYTEDQWIRREFYRVHETLNFVFLKFGIVGFLFLLSFLYWILKQIKSRNSQLDVYLCICLVFGVAFMLGYSLKLAIFLGVLLGIFAKSEVNGQTCDCSASRKGH